MAQATLGSGIGKTIVSLTDVILVEEDNEKRKSLKRQLRELVAQNKKLVDKQVPNDTNSYRKATEHLAKANQALKDAKKGIESVAKAINKVATAISWVEKVVSTVL